MKHNKAVTDEWETIVFVKQALHSGNFSGAAEAMAELEEETRMALNLAPTKGGVFTLEDNKLLRSDEYAAARTQYFEDKKDG